MVTTRSQDNDQAEQPESVAAETSNPSNLIYKSGDVLKATEQYIVHQCNCVTTTSAGLANAIAKQFPYADPYSHRRPDPNRASRCVPEDAAKPGTIQVWRPPQDMDGPSFIGLYAQIEVTKSRKMEGDTKQDREEYFRKCMDLIAERMKDVKSLALPWQIGCGLARGDWNVYQGIIKEWAEKHPDITIAIYKLEGAENSSRGRGRGRGGGRGRGEGRGRGRGTNRGSGRSG